MFTALILAAAVAGMTPFQEAAYFSGRCLRFMSIDLQREIERDIDRLDPSLHLFMMQGTKDEVREPTSLVVCEIVMKDVTERIKQLPSPNPQSSARDTGKR